jgi:hypothetical protein
MLATPVDKCFACVYSALRCGRAWAANLRSKASMRTSACLPNIMPSSWSAHWTKLNPLIVGPVHSQIRGVTSSSLSCAQLLRGLLILIACGLTKAAPDGPSGSSCRRIPSDLLKVINSSDPIRVASNQGITTQGGQLYLELQTTADDDYLRGRYGTDVTSRSSMSNYVLAYVPPDLLCALADDPQVQGVRVPDTPVWQGPSRE